MSLGMGSPKCRRGGAGRAAPLAVKRVEPGLVLLLPDQWVFAASGTDRRTLGVDAAALPRQSRHYFLCVATTPEGDRSDWIATTSKHRVGCFLIPEVHKDGYPPWVGRDSFCKVERVYRLETTALEPWVVDGASARRNFVGERAVEELAWCITDWAS